MSKHVFKIENGAFGLTLTDPEVTDACTATIDDFDAFTCQITNGALTRQPERDPGDGAGDVVRPGGEHAAGRRHLLQPRDRPTCRTPIWSTACRGSCSSTTPTSRGSSWGCPVTTRRRRSARCGSRPARSAARAGSR